MASDAKEQIFELITMNRQGGYTYSVKIKDIPSPFVGIPVASSEDPDKFLMEVTNTGADEESRLVEGNIADIEFMEKC